VTVVAREVQQPVSGHDTESEVSENNPTDLRRRLVGSPLEDETLHGRGSGICACRSLSGCGCGNEVCVDTLGEILMSLNIVGVSEPLIYHVEGVRHFGAYHRRAG